MQAIRKIATHIALWVVCILIITGTYRPGLPSFSVALIAATMVVPVHILYYYAVTVWVMPRYMYTRKYFKLFSTLLFNSLLAALLFRLLEILIIVPYINGVLLNNDPTLVWAKAQGSFGEQLINPTHLINALEQSNLVVWILLSFRFLNLWQERKQMAVQAELNFLKGQIHPHFLFNTLNNLYALTLNTSAQAPEVVLGLSNILRYMLYECSNERVALNRDVEILTSYIDLERIRYDARLDLNISIEGNLHGKYIAPLLMLPLVENAFKHGAGELIEQAWINIDIKATDTTVACKISNSKPLAQENKYTDKYFGSIGLENVKKRLQLLYPQTHQLQIMNEDEMFVAILKISLDRKYDLAIQGENTHVLMKTTIENLEANA
jgi:hypothetical protein